jgi:hypothetical protein
MENPQRRPCIDKSTLISDVWEIDPVLQVERRLQDHLVQPGVFEKMCIHEGAHLYYVRKIYCDAKIFPPSVMYYSGKFRPVEAGINIHGMDKCCDRNRLLTFVKGLQAGGIAEAAYLLAQSPTKTPAEIGKELGDDDDIMNYAEHCSLIRAASPGLEFDEKEVWIEAERAVIDEICTPHIRAELTVVTEEVRQFLQAAMYPDLPPTL